MLRTLKWIYQLGKLHERRRIRLELRQWRDSYRYQDDIGIYDSDKYFNEIDNGVRQVLDKILHPMQTQYVEKSLLDEDDEL